MQFLRAHLRHVLARPPATTRRGPPPVAVRPGRRGARGSIRPVRPRRPHRPAGGDLRLQPLPHLRRRRPHPSRPLPPNRPDPHHLAGRAAHRGRPVGHRRTRHPPHRRPLSRPRRHRGGLGRRDLLGPHLQNPDSDHPAAKPATCSSTRTTRPTSPAAGTSPACLPPAKPVTACTTSSGKALSGPPNTRPGPPTGHQSTAAQIRITSSVAIIITYISPYINCAIQLFVVGSQSFFSPIRSDSSKIATAHVFVG